ncbi:MAG: isopentenyl-diphosphate Delta-isomerase [Gemmatimonadetes bacterium]|nr:isopentenyl-diphosphate Delta-isomerase [Gemmatimonadota bacterium]
MTASVVEVILVNDRDEEVGRCEKLAAHEQGLLHRAVSVFVFDADGRWLIQQRADGKYHSGGLWSNAACTHPRAGESLEAAVRRAAREELGAELADVTRAFPLVYHAAVGNGLVEHEFDHVFTARLAGPLAPVAAEVSGVAWQPLDALQLAVEADPAAYTPWFRLLLPLVIDHRAARVLPGGPLTT